MFLGNRYYQNKFRAKQNKSFILELFIKIGIQISIRQEINKQK